MFYTYVHTKPNGSIFYIGKGTGVRAWKKTRRNSHWKNIVSKYKSYNVQILANWNTEQEALDHEILLISCFRDMGYKLANLKCSILATNVKTNIQIILSGTAEMESAGFQSSNVFKCLNGKRKSHKGYTFKRLEI